MRTVQTEVWSWAVNAHSKLWQSSDGCRQAKMFLKGPDKQLPHFALGIKRKQLRILVGLLTGHIALNRHLNVMKIRTDPLCPACGEEVETSYHLLGKCCAYMLSRYSIKGAHTMKSEELGKVRPTTLRFARTTKRFSRPLVVLGLCIGPNIHGLSTGRLQLSAAKVKVKVMRRC